MNKLICKLMTVLAWLIVTVSILNAQQDFTARYQTDKDIILVRWYPLNAMLYLDPADSKKMHSNFSVNESYRNIVLIGVSHQELKGSKKTQVSRETLYKEVQLVSGNRRIYSPLSPDELNANEISAITQLEISLNNEKEDKIYLLPFRRFGVDLVTIIKETKTDTFAIRYRGQDFQFSGPVLFKDQRAGGDFAVQPKDEYKDIVPLVLVEIQPRFSGGDIALKQYLSGRVKYPEGAIENGTQGIVLVSFVVEKDGSLTEVKADKDPGDGLGSEVVKAIKKMPLWTPAYIEGLPVRVRMKVPFEFKLK